MFVVENSRPVSKLPEIDFLNDSCDLIVSKNINGEFESWKIGVQELCRKLAHDISAKLDLGSMSKRNDFNFARRNHSHDYSVFHMFPAIKWSDLSGFYEDGASPYDSYEYLGTVVQTFDDKSLSPISTDIFQPRLHTLVVNEPAIGQTEILYREIDGENDDFSIEHYNGQTIFKHLPDGGYWTYTNGQTIQCGSDEFVEACKIYGNNGKNGNDTSFTIPLISGYIRMNPGLYYDNSVNFMKSHTSIPYHTHEIGIPEEQSVEDILSVKASVPRCSTGTQKPYVFHGGSGTDLYKKKKYFNDNYLSIELTINDAKTSPCDTEYYGDGEQTTPRSVTVKSLVYIGKKK